MVPRERPRHPRRACQEGNCGTYLQDCNNGDHYRAPSCGAGGLDEDFHERVAGRRILCCVEISKAKQDSEKHAKTQEAIQCDTSK